VEFILFLCVVVAVVVLPIKLAATWVGAVNTGFWSCLLAVFFSSVVSGGFEHVAPELAQNQLISFLIIIPISGFIYMFVLETSFIKGNIIAVLQFVLTIIIGLILASAFSGFEQLTT
jgi:hypothetical protein